MNWFEEYDVDAFEVFVIDDEEASVAGLKDGTAEVIWEYEGADAVKTAEAVRQALVDGYNWKQEERKGLDQDGRFRPLVVW